MAFAEKRVDLFQQLSMSPNCVSRSPNVWAAALNGSYGLVVSSARAALLWPLVSERACEGGDLSTWLHCS